MKRITFIHSIEIMDQAGTIGQHNSIVVEYWQKSFIIDGIEFKYGKDLITVPMMNIAAIIETQN